MVSLAASADPFRDELPISSYRLLGGTLAQLRDNAPLAVVSKSLDLIAPLTRGLDQKHGTEVERLLRRAVEANDRDGAFAATTVLVLLDTQDLLEGIARDDYTGWADAKVRTRKAFLNYQLIAEVMRRQQGDLDQRAILAFGRLVADLHDSDMSTAPESIATVRNSVVSALIAMRAALSRTPPRAGDGGIGG